MSFEVEGMSTRLLKLNEVCHKLSVSRSFIYRHMKLGRFPRAVELGRNCVRWREADIDAWIEQKLPAASRS